MLFASSAAVTTCNSANAENNNNLSADSLTVKSAIIENGPVLKRFKAGARGTAMPRRKKMSHIRIVLSDGNDTGSKIPPETAATIANQRGVTMHAVAIGDPATRGNEKVQLATLQDIARIGKGSFALGTDQRQLTAIYQRLDALEKQDFQTLSYRARHPLFHWPLALAVALMGVLQLILMLSASWRRMRHE